MADNTGSIPRRPPSCASIGWRRFRYASAMNSVPSDFKKLPVSERIQLVEDIWDSIAEEAVPLQLSADEREELRRRMAEHTADPESGIAWQEVRCSLFKDRD